jgi:hypothetical protein
LGSRYAIALLVVPLLVGCFGMLLEQKSVLDA